MACKSAPWGQTTYCTRHQVTVRNSLQQNTQGTLAKVARESAQGAKIHFAGAVAHPNHDLHLPTLTQLCGTRGLKGPRSLEVFVPRSVGGQEAMPRGPSCFAPGGQILLSLARVPQGAKTACTRGPRELAPGAERACPRRRNILSGPCVSADVRPMFQEEKST
jgi:hypothetical protein